MKKHIIWSDADLNLEDWRADLQSEHPDYSDDELYQLMVETNAEYLNDERHYNLNIQLSQPILVIADLGRWNGRFSGYKEILSGNIGDCLYSDTYATWFVDELGDFRCDAIHHDGTNHYLYRVYKDGVSEAQKDNLKEKIYDGVATRADIVRITRRLGDNIGKVYGWEFPRRGRKKGAA